ncbi:MAG: zf-HC2 domain-containing protein [Myxococcota bacterium]
MSDCRQAIDLLVDLLEGNVSPEVREGVLEHMRDCPPCRWFMESYKDTTVLCHEGLKRQLPEGMTQRLLQYLREHAKDERPPEDIKQS